MPTKDRLLARAAADALLDLHEAADRANYAPESLRKMMWSPNPPPLFKLRGRWRVRAADLDAWLAQRDGAVAS